MGLSENYKETLKSSGIKSDLETYKPKRRHVYIIILIVVIAIAAPTYFLIFQNYTTCYGAANYLSMNTSGSNAQTITNSFSFKCGMNSILYSSIIALVIAIISLFLLKVLKTAK
ncbi:MAG: hypothetical protein M1348_01440 [Candidatus Parvarchaeota archaeon]|nr:hypothetical protein [Candidatus Parvarchaeota archaeon]